MSLKSNIPFGAWVVVTSILIRMKSGNKRFWFRRPINPHKCLFLGARNFADGTVDWESHGINGQEGSSLEFSADKYIKGALVCPPSGKPFKTLLEDCKLAPVELTKGAFITDLKVPEGY